MLKSWILCLLAAGFLGAAVKAAGDSRQKGPLGLACGLLTVTALLYPLTRGEATIVPLEFDSYRRTVLEAIDLRSQQDSRTLLATVEQQCADYICAQAAAMGVDCRVQVHCTLREDGVPVPTSCRIVTTRPLPSALYTLMENALGLAPDRITVVTSD